MSAQFPDNLHYQDQDFALHVLPLESWLDASGTRPHLDELYRHTACHRGYVADWEIRNGHLLLIDVVTLNGDPFPFGAVFGDAILPIPADWFSGILRCPFGALIQYVHFDFHSLYASEHLLSIRKGMLEGERTVSNCTPPVQRPDEQDVPDFLRRQEPEDERPA